MENKKRKVFTFYLIVCLFISLFGAIIGTQNLNFSNRLIDANAEEKEYSIVFSREKNYFHSATKTITTQDGNKIVFSASGFGSPRHGIIDTSEYFAVINYDVPFEFKNEYMPEFINKNRISGIKEINIDYTSRLGTYTDPSVTDNSLAIELYIEYGWDVNLENSSYYGDYRVYGPSTSMDGIFPSYFRIHSEYNDRTPNTVNEPLIFIRSIEIVYSCSRSDVGPNGLTILPYMGGGIDSTVQEKTYYVADYSGDASTITIPRNFNDGIICAIGEEAFKDNKKITRVILPDTVSILRNRAFSNCLSLRYINLENIELMQDYVFENCVSLESAKIPNLVTRTYGQENFNSQYAFYHCTNLKEVIVGFKSFGRYKPYFVVDCENLEKIVVRCTSMKSNFVSNAPKLKLACIGVSLTNPDVDSYSKPFPDQDGLNIVVENNDSIRLYDYDKATVYTKGRFIENDSFLVSGSPNTTLLGYFGDYDPLVIPNYYIFSDNSTYYGNESHRSFYQIDIDDFENYHGTAYFKGSYDEWERIKKVQTIGFDVAFYNELGTNMDSDTLYWRYVDEKPTLW